MSTQAAPVEEAAKPSPIAPSRLAAEEALWERQTGIKPWSELEKRVTETAEPPAGESKERVRDLKVLTPSQREEWRKTGDVPIVKSDKAPAEKPFDLKDLTREEREKWRSETGGDFPKRDPAKTTEAKTDAPVEAPKTPEARRVQHEKNFSEFSKSGLADAELKTALDAIQLDPDRGTVVLHTLADLTGDQRRELAKELAGNPDLAAEMVKRDSKGEYIYSREQVRDVVLGMSNRLTTSAQRIETQVKDARERYPDADARIFGAHKAITSDPKIPQSVKLALNNSPVMVDLMYVLGEPSALADIISIAKTNPEGALKKLGVTERLVMEQVTRSQLGKASPPKSAPITKAPKPISEIGGRASGIGDSEADAVKAGDFRAAKSAFSREYLRRHSER